MFLLQEGDTIPLESYARIKHLQTKRWLHLEKGVQIFIHRNLNMQHHFCMQSQLDEVSILCGMHHCLYSSEPTSQKNSQSTLKHAIRSPHNTLRYSSLMYWSLPYWPSQTLIHSGFFYLQCYSWSKFSHDSQKISSSYIAHRGLQIRGWNISVRGSPMPKQWAFRASYLCGQYHTVDNILCACIPQLILSLTSRQKVQTKGVWPKGTWTQRTAMGRCRIVHGRVGGERGGAKRGDRRTNKIIRKMVNFVIWVVKRD